MKKSITRRDFNSLLLTAGAAAGLVPGSAEAAQNRRRKSGASRASGSTAERWVAIAEELKPVLRRKATAPVRLVEPEKDPASFQGWHMKPAGEISSILGKPLRKGDSFTLDFGTHLVGYLRLGLEFAGPAQDAPVRLKLVFGEVPAEIAEPFDPYPGTLSRAWLQDETVNIDVLPCALDLPRRYAFRYLKITVVDTSPEFRVRFKDIKCDAVTAVAAAARRLPDSTPDLLRRIDEVSLKTLADCMQTVFEDGPKRDRRLWIGDLRVQALTNYESFRNFDLVKRCLYLFAGLTREDGLISGCIFEEPVPARGHTFCADYATFFGPVLLDYANASGDWATARELWPVAAKQIELMSKHVDGSGIFVNPGNPWIFIDWNNRLDKQASMQAVMIYSTRRTLELARALGRESDVADYPEIIERMTAASLAKLWDSSRGVVVSGSSRQVSWASQAWMILAGVLDKGEGRVALRAVMEMEDAVRPGTPYLYHHILEAMIACGLTGGVRYLLESYWGDMVRKGADTFWEVYDPKNELLSPYNSHLVNSYCHAWSCTPAYFIRKYGRELGAWS